MYLIPIETRTFTLVYVCTPGKKSKLFRCLRKFINQTRWLPMSVEEKQSHEGIVQTVWSVHHWRQEVNWVWVIQVNPPIVLNCGPEVIGVPSIFKLIRSVSVLVRMLVTLDLRCEENGTRWKWKFVSASWTPEVVRKLFPDESVKIEDTHIHTQTY